MDVKKKNRLEERSLCVARELLIAGVEVSRWIYIWTGVRYKWYKSKR